MERVVAKRPGRVLVATGRGMGYILDAGGMSHPVHVQTTLDGGGWAASTMTLAEARRFCEARVPAHLTPFSFGSSLHYASSRS